MDVRRDNHSAIAVAGKLLIEQLMRHVLLASHIFKLVSVDDNMCRECVEKQSK